MENLNDPNIQEGQVPVTSPEGAVPVEQDQQMMSEADIIEQGQIQEHLNQPVYQETKSGVIIKDPYATQPGQENVSGHSEVFDGPKQSDESAEGTPPKPAYHPEEVSKQADQDKGNVTDYYKFFVQLNSQGKNTQEINAELQRLASEYNYSVQLPTLESVLEEANTTQKQSKEARALTVHEETQIKRIYSKAEAGYKEYLNNEFIPNLGGTGDYTFYNKLAGEPENKKSVHSNYGAKLNRLGLYATSSMYGSEILDLENTLNSNRGQQISSSSNLQKIKTDETTATDNAIRDGVVAMTDTKGKLLYNEDGSVKTRELTMEQFLLGEGRMLVYDDNTGQAYLALADEENPVEDLRKHATILSSWDQANFESKFNPLYTVEKFSKTVYGTGLKMTAYGADVVDRVLNGDESGPSTLRTEFSRKKYLEGSAQLGLTNYDQRGSAFENKYAFGNHVLAAAESYAPMVLLSLIPKVGSKLGMGYAVAMSAESAYDEAIKSGVLTEDESLLYSAAVGGVTLAVTNYLQGDMLNNLYRRVSPQVHKAMARKAFTEVTETMAKRGVEFGTKRTAEETVQAFTKFPMLQQVRNTLGLVKSATKPLSKKISQWKNSSMYAPALFNGEGLEEVAEEWGQTTINRAIRSYILANSEGRDAEKMEEIFRGKSSLSEKTWDEIAQSTLETFVASHVGGILTDATAITMKRAWGHTMDQTSPESISAMAESIVRDRISPETFNKYALAGMKTGEFGSLSLDRNGQVAFNAQDSQAYSLYKTVTDTYSKMYQTAEAMGFFSKDIRKLIADPKKRSEIANLLSESTNNATYHLDALQRAILETSRQKHITEINQAIRNNISGKADPSKPLAVNRDEFSFEKYGTTEKAYNTAVGNRPSRFNDSADEITKLAKKYHETSDEVEDLIMATSYGDTYLAVKKRIFLQQALDGIIPDSPEAVKRRAEISRELKTLDASYGTAYNDIVDGISADSPINELVVNKIQSLQAKVATEQIHDGTVLRNALFESSLLTNLTQLREQYNKLEDTSSEGAQALQERINTLEQYFSSNPTDPDYYQRFQERPVIDGSGSILGEAGKAFDASRFMNESANKKGVGIAFESNFTEKSAQLVLDALEAAQAITNADELSEYLNTTLVDEHGYITMTLEDLKQFKDQLVASKLEVDPVSTQDIVEEGFYVEEAVPIVREVIEEGSHIYSFSLMSPQGTIAIPGITVEITPSEAIIDSDGIVIPDQLSDIYEEFRQAARSLSDASPDEDIAKFNDLLSQFQEGIQAEYIQTTANEENARTVHSDSIMDIANAAIDPHIETLENSQETIHKLLERQDQALLEAFTGGDVDMLSGEVEVPSGKKKDIRTTYAKSVLIKEASSEFKELSKDQLLELLQDAGFTNVTPEQSFTDLKMALVEELPGMIEEIGKTDASDFRRFRKELITQEFLNQFYNEYGEILQNSFGFTPPVRDVFAMEEDLYSRSTQEIGKYVHMTEFIESVINVLGESRFTRDDMSEGIIAQHLLGFFVPNGYAENSTFDAVFKPTYISALQNFYESSDGESKELVKKHLDKISNLMNLVYGHELDSLDRNNPSKGSLRYRINQLHLNGSMGVEDVHTMAREAQKMVRDILVDRPEYLGIVDAEGKVPERLQAHVPIGAGSMYNSKTTSDLITFLAFDDGQFYATLKQVLNEHTEKYLDYNPEAINETDHIPPMPSIEQMGVLRHIVAKIVSTTQGLATKISTEQLSDAVSFINGPAASGKTTYLGKYSLEVTSKMLGRKLNVLHTAPFAAQSNKLQETLTQDPTDNLTFTSLPAVDKEGHFIELIRALNGTKETSIKLKDLDVILIDEGTLVRTETQQELIEAVNTYNKSAAKLIHLLVMGDPYQLSLNREGKIGSHTDQGWAGMEAKYEIMQNPVPYQTFRFSYKVLSDLQEFFEQQIHRIGISKYTSKESSDYVSVAKGLSGIQYADKGQGIRHGLKVTGVEELVSDFKTHLAQVEEYNKANPESTRSIMLVYDDGTEGYVREYMNKILAGTKRPIVRHISEAQGDEVDSVYALVSRSTETGKAIEDNSYTVRKERVATSRGRDYVHLATFGGDNDSVGQEVENVRKYTVPTASQQLDRNRVLADKLTAWAGTSVPPIIPAVETPEVTSSEVEEEVVTPEEPVVENPTETTTEEQSEEKKEEKKEEVPTKPDPEGTVTQGNVKVNKPTELKYNKYDPESLAMVPVSIMASTAMYTNPDTQDKTAFVVNTDQMVFAPDHPEANADGWLASENLEKTVAELTDGGIGLAASFGEVVKAMDLRNEGSLIDSLQVMAKTFITQTVSSPDKAERMPSDRLEHLNKVLSRSTYMDAALNLADRVVEDNPNVTITAGEWAETVLVDIPTALDQFSKMSPSTELLTDIMGTFTQIQEHVENLSTLEGLDFSESKGNVAFLASLATSADQLLGQYKTTIAGLANTYDTVKETEAITGQTTIDVVTGTKDSAIPEILEEEGFRPDLDTPGLEVKVVRGLDPNELDTAFFNVHVKSNDEGAQFSYAYFPVPIGTKDSGNYRIYKYDLSVKPEGGSPNDLAERIDLLQSILSKYSEEFRALKKIADDSMTANLGNQGKLILHTAFSNRTANILGTLTPEKQEEVLKVLNDQKAVLNQKLVNRINVQKGTQSLLASDMAGISAVTAEGDIEVLQGTGTFKVVWNEAYENGADYSQEFNSNVKGHNTNRYSFVYEEGDSEFDLGVIRKQYGVGDSGPGKGRLTKGPAITATEDLLTKMFEQSLGSAELSDGDSITIGNKLKLGDVVRPGYISGLAKTTKTKTPVYTSIAELKDNPEFTDVLVLTNKNLTIGFNAESGATRIVGSSNSAASMMGIPSLNLAGRAVVIKRHKDSDLSVSQIEDILTDPSRVSEAQELFKRQNIQILLLNTAKGGINLDMYTDLMDMWQHKGDTYSVDLGNQEGNKPITSPSHVIEETMKRYMATAALKQLSDGTSLGPAGFFQIVPSQLGDVTIDAQHFAAASFRPTRQQTQQYRKWLKEGGEKSGKPRPSLRSRGGKIYKMTDNRLLLSEKDVNIEQEREQMELNRAINNTAFSRYNNSSTLKGKSKLSEGLQESILFGMAPLFEGFDKYDATDASKRSSKKFLEEGPAAVFSTQEKLKVADNALNNIGAFLSSVTDTDDIESTKQAILDLATEIESDIVRAQIANILTASSTIQALRSQLIPMFQELASSTDLGYKIQIEAMGNKLNGYRSAVSKDRQNEPSNSFAFPLGILKKSVTEKMVATGEISLREVTLISALFNDLLIKTANKVAKLEEGIAPSKIKKAITYGPDAVRLLIKAVKALKASNDSMLANMAVIMEAQFGEVHIPYLGVEAKQQSKGVNQAAAKLHPKIAKALKGLDTMYQLQDINSMPALNLIVDFQQSLDLEKFMTNSPEAPASTEGTTEVAETTETVNTEETAESEESISSPASETMATYEEAIKDTVYVKVDFSAESEEEATVTITPIDAETRRPIPGRKAVVLLGDTEQLADFEFLTGERASQDVAAAIEPLTEIEVDVIEVPKPRGGRRISFNVDKVEPHNFTTSQEYAEKMFKERFGTKYVHLEFEPLNSGNRQILGYVQGAKMVYKRNAEGMIDDHTLLHEHIHMGMRLINKSKRNRILTNARAYYGLDSALSDSAVEEHLARIYPQIDREIEVTGASRLLARMPKFLRSFISFFRDLIDRVKILFDPESNADILSFISDIKGGVFADYVEYNADLNTSMEQFNNIRGNESAAVREAKIMNGLQKYFNAGTKLEGDTIIASPEAVPFHNVSSSVTERLISFMSTMGPEGTLQDLTVRRKNGGHDSGLRIKENEDGTYEVLEKEFIYPTAIQSLYADLKDMAADVTRFTFDLSPEADTEVRANSIAKVLTTPILLDGHTKPILPLEQIALSKIGPLSELMQESIEVTKDRFVHTDVNIVNGDEGSQTATDDAGYLGYKKHSYSPDVKAFLSYIPKLDYVGSLSMHTDGHTMRGVSMDMAEASIDPNSSTLTLREAKEVLERGFEEAQKVVGAHATMADVDNALMRIANSNSSISLRNAAASLSYKVFSRYNPHSILNYASYAGVRRPIKPDGYTQVDYSNTKERHRIAFANLMTALYRVGNNLYMMGVVNGDSFNGIDYKAATNQDVAKRQIWNQMRTGIGNTLFNKLENRSNSMLEATLAHYGFNLTAEGSKMHLRPLTFGAHLNSALDETFFMSESDAVLDLEGDAYEAQMDFEDLVKTIIMYAQTPSNQSGPAEYSIPFMNSYSPAVKQRVKKLIKDILDTDVVFGRDNVLKLKGIENTRYTGLQGVSFTFDAENPVSGNVLQASHAGDLNARQIRYLLGIFGYRGEALDALANVQDKTIAVKGLGQIFAAFIGNEARYYKEAPNDHRSIMSGYVREYGSKIIAAKPRMQDAGFIFSNTANGTPIYFPDYQVFNDWITQANVKVFTTKKTSAETANGDRRSTKVNSNAMFQRLSTYHALQNGAVTQRADEMYYEYANNNMFMRTTMTGEELAGEGSPRIVDIPMKNTYKNPLTGDIKDMAELTATEASKAMLLDNFSRIKSQLSKGISSMLIDATTNANKNTQYMIGIEGSNIYGTPTTRTYLSEDREGKAIYADSRFDVNAKDTYNALTSYFFKNTVPALKELGMTIGNEMKSSAYKSKISLLVSNIEAPTRSNKAIVPPYEGIMELYAEINNGLTSLPDGISLVKRSLLRSGVDYVFAKKGSPALRLPGSSVTDLEKTTFGHDLEPTVHFDELGLGDLLSGGYEYFRNKVFGDAEYLVEGLTNGFDLTEGSLPIVLQDVLAMGQTLEGETNPVPTFNSADLKEYQAAAGYQASLPATAFRNTHVYEMRDGKVFFNPFVVDLAANYFNYSVNADALVGVNPIMFNTIKKGKLSIVEAVKRGIATKTSIESPALRERGDTSKETNALMPMDINAVVIEDINHGDIPNADLYDETYGYDPSVQTTYIHTKNKSMEADTVEDAIHKGAQTLEKEEEGFNAIAYTSPLVFHLLRNSLAMDIRGGVKMGNYGNKDLQKFSLHPLNEDVLLAGGAYMTNMFKQSLGGEGSPIYEAWKKYRNNEYYHTWNNKLVSLINKGEEEGENTEDRKQVALVAAAMQETLKEAMEAGKDMTVFTKSQVFANMVFDKLDTSESLVDIVRLVRTTTNSINALAIDVLKHGVHENRLLEWFKQNRHKTIISYVTEKARTDARRMGIPKEALGAVVQGVKDVLSEVTINTAKTAAIDLGNDRYINLGQYMQFDSRAFDSETGLLKHFKDGDESLPPLTIEEIFLTHFITPVSGSKVGVHGVSNSQDISRPYVNTVKNGESFGFVLKLENNTANPEGTAPTQMNYILGAFFDNSTATGDLYQALADNSKTKLEQFNQEVFERIAEKVPGSKVKKHLSEGKTEEAISEIERYLVEGKIDMDEMTSWMNEKMIANLSAMEHGQVAASLAASGVSIDHPNLRKDLLGAISNSVRSNTTRRRIKSLRYTVRVSDGTIRMGTVKNAQGDVVYYGDLETATRMEGPNGINPLLVQGISIRMPDGTVHRAFPNHESSDLLNMYDLDVDRMKDEGGEVISTTEYKLHPAYSGGNYRFRTRNLEYNQMMNKGKEIFVKPFLPSQRTSVKMVADPVVEMSSLPEDPAVRQLAIDELVSQGYVHLKPNQKLDEKEHQQLFWGFLRALENYETSLKQIGSEYDLGSIQNLVAAEDAGTLPFADYSAMYVDAASSYFGVTPMEIGISRDFLVDYQIPSHVTLAELENRPDGPARLGRFVLNNRRGETDGDKMLNALKALKLEHTDGYQSISNQVLANGGEVTPLALSEFNDLVWDEFQEDLTGIAVRIPTTGYNSAQFSKVGYFLDNVSNSIAVPSYLMVTTGADNDGDQVTFLHNAKYDDKNPHEHQIYHILKDRLVQAHNLRQLFTPIGMEDLDTYTFNDEHAFKAKKNTMYSNALINEHNQVGNATIGVIVKFNQTLITYSTQLKNKGSKGEFNGEEGFTFFGKNYKSLLGSGEGEYEIELHTKGLKSKLMNTDTFADTWEIVDSSLSQFPEVEAAVSRYAEAGMAYSRMLAAEAQEEAKPSERTSIYNDMVAAKKQLDQVVADAIVENAGNTDTLHALEKYRDIRYNAYGTSPGLYSAQYVSVLDMSDQVAQASLDNAKEAKLSKLNVTKYTWGILEGMLYLGVDLQHMYDILRHPITKEYISEIQAKSDITKILPPSANDLYTVLKKKIREKMKEGDNPGTGVGNFAQEIFSKSKISNTDLIAQYNSYQLATPNKGRAGEISNEMAGELNKAAAVIDKLKMELNAAKQASNIDEINSLKDRIAEVSEVIRHARSSKNTEVAEENIALRTDLRKQLEPLVKHYNSLVQGPARNLKKTESQYSKSLGSETAKNSVVILSIFSDVANAKKSFLEASNEQVYNGALLERFYKSYFSNHSELDLEDLPENAFKDIIGQRALEPNVVSLAEAKVFNIIRNKFMPNLKSQLDRKLADTNLDLAATNFLRRVNEEGSLAGKGTDYVPAKTTNAEDVVYRDYFDHVLFTVASVGRHIEAIREIVTLTTEGAETDSHANEQKIEKILEALGLYTGNLLEDINTVMEIDGMDDTAKETFIAGYADRAINAREIFFRNPMIIEVFKSFKDDMLLKSMHTLANDELVYSIKTQLTQFNRDNRKSANKSKIEIEEDRIYTNMFLNMEKDSDGNLDIAPESPTNALYGSINSDVKGKLGTSNPRVALLASLTTAPTTNLIERIAFAKKFVDYVSEAQTQLYATGSAVEAEMTSALATYIGSLRVDSSIESGTPAVYLKSMGDEDKAELQQTFAALNENMSNTPFSSQAAEAELFRRVAVRYGMITTGMGHQRMNLSGTFDASALKEYSNGLKEIKKAMVKARQILSGKLDADNNARSWALKFQEKMVNYYLSEMPSRLPDVLNSVDFNPKAESEWLTDREAEIKSDDDIQDSFLDDYRLEELSQLSEDEYYNQYEDYFTGVEKVRSDVMSTGDQTMKGYEELNQYFEPIIEVTESRYDDEESTSESYNVTGFEFNPTAFQVLSPQQIGMGRTPVEMKANTYKPLPAKVKIKMKGQTHPTVGVREAELIYTKRAVVSKGMVAEVYVLDSSPVNRGAFNDYGSKATGNLLIDSLQDLTDPRKIDSIMRRANRLKSDFNSKIKTSLSYGNLLALDVEKYEETMDTVPNVALYTADNSAELHFIDRAGRTYAVSNVLTANSTVNLVDKEVRNKIAEDITKKC